MGDDPFNIHTRAAFVNSIGSNYVELIDGFTRVYIELDDSKIDRKNNPENILKIDYIKFYPGSDYDTSSAQVEVMPSKGIIARGHYLPAGQDYTYNFDHLLDKATNNVIIDVLFLTEGEHINIMLGDWSEYSGYYNLSKVTTNSSYNGVTVTNLDDGYIRFAFELNALTKVNDKPLPSTTYKMMHLKGGWSTSDTYIDISYVNLLESPVIEDIY